MYVDVSDMNTDEFADQKARLEKLLYEFTFNWVTGIICFVTHFLYEETSASYHFSFSLHAVVVAK